MGECEIALRPATDADRELYRNLFNLMHGEIAPYTSELGTIDARGYFDYDATDPYFQGDENVFPLIIEADGCTVGFVVMTRAPYVKPGCDFCIQELMVLRSYRGRGIATQVCRRLFSENSGRWCCIALTGNIRAVKFWQDLIATSGRLLGSDRLDSESIFFEFIV